MLELTAWLFSKQTNPKAQQQGQILSVESSPASNRSHLEEKAGFQSSSFPELTGPDAEVTRSDQEVQLMETKPVAFWRRRLKLFLKLSVSFVLEYRLMHIETHTLGTKLWSQRKLHRCKAT